MASRYNHIAFLPGVLLLLALSPAHAELTASLTSSLPSGQPVGTPAVWTATASGGTALLYRFAVQPAGGAWLVVQDFSTATAFPWTTLDEGSYRIAVEVYDVAANISTRTAIAFDFVSRVKGQTPVVSPTANPLVALYSAPPCNTGSVRVLFQASARFSFMQTPSRPCQPGKSLNFYLAGMYQNTEYSILQQNIAGGSTSLGPLITYRTGSPAIPVPPLLTVQAADANTSLSDRVFVVASYLLRSPEYPPVATDLFGNVIWYYPINPFQAPAILLRPTPAATMMLLLASVDPADGSVIVGQRLREVDLAGNLVRETNVNALNLQLKARGDDLIDWLAHEGLRLPNGHTLTFGTTERILTNVQGPGNVDVVGDMIIDLDENFQVSWTWNPFNFLDTTRQATLNDTCVISCGPLRLAPTFNDWTHSNSIHFLPSDGSLVVSVRNQDWVIKIDYGNGSGTGKVLWRLGKGGDFAVVSSDPWPWFSHQHDVEFDGNNFELYDNGNTRLTEHAGTTSRGQVWTLDEASLTARLILNVDMGVFSRAVGSAQHLTNGNYQFLNGNLETAKGPAAWLIQVLPDGTKNLQVAYGAYAYRVFAARDLYSYTP
ncbi:MAG: aryl-sulfate sulfotransferase [Acidobacteriota bacterium]